MSTIANASMALVAVLGRAEPGLYTIHVRSREDDRMEKYATERIDVSRPGLTTVVQGSMGAVSRLLMEAMNAVDGGYLVLTNSREVFGRTVLTTYVWRILAGHLTALKGDEGWHVTQFHSEAQGGLWMDADTRYEDAWEVSVR